MSQNGKGDKRRPLKISEQKFRENWNKAFDPYRIEKQKKELQNEQK